MSTPIPQEMTLDAIRSVPLFASLDDEATRELRSLLRTREALPAAAFEAAWSAGRTLSFEAAMAEADAWVAGSNSAARS